MLRQLMRLLTSLWRPFGGRGGDAAGGGGGGDGAAGREGRDGLLWYRDLGRCAGGEFSMAVVQANQVLEDQSQIESGPFGTFIGVYDGHGGPDAARYVCDHLFSRFREISSGPQGVTSDDIRRAFLATEESFVTLVSQLWNTQPDIATTGCCCLVGVICQRTLYVANLGDSRAVLGKKVSRAIGDAYMKYAQYNREPINSKFRIPEPMNMPILTANPSITTHHLQPSDSFLIFASDGLWEHLSDQKAVEIVHSHPRAGSAKRLIKAALHEAAKKREMRYSDLKRIDKKVRRHFHDDITVIVVFLNHDLMVKGSTQGPQLSVRNVCYA
ncbi:hypothetical protein C4D60_Mb11t11930 [Musa balbisiana]|uniref:protein-serine/threonine phosphatase n=1 Tax=Musa balbisiana TaxID=52838 RepID=A0A4S8J4D2_MUSBA|nr:hypothetical protein C4D60_Mb11t11930 [Musa balbisiana]